MKNFIILISLTLLNIQTLFSQDCDFKRKEVDETTNDKIVETKEINLIVELTGWMDVSVIKNGHQYFMNIVYNNTDITMIDKGNFLFFKLNNDSVITLKNSENAISDISNKINLVYPVKESDLQAIAKLGIYKLRIHSHNNYTDHEISPTRNKKFVHAVKCVLNN